MKWYDLQHISTSNGAKQGGVYQPIYMCHARTSAKRDRLSGNPTFTQ